MVLRYTLLAMACVVSCAGKRNKPASDAIEFVPTMVEIDLSTEQNDDDLDGIELKQVTADCGALLDLEPSARLGRLSGDQIRCLNNAMQEAKRQTSKDKLSRLLLGDAWAKGDVHRWAGVAARHLAEVDRADPDLVYQYAYQLVQLGNPERMDEATYWANAALDNKAYWEGEVHVRRVYSLHKVKTLAMLKKWEYLEGRYRAEPTEALQQEVEATRNVLKTFSREWLDYAKSSARDTTEPMRVCTMAAGTEDFCTQQ